jgi:hypothetical protein
MRVGASEKRAKHLRMERERETLRFGSEREKRKNQRLMGGRRRKRRKERRGSCPNIHNTNLTLLVR